MQNVHYRRSTKGQILNSEAFIIIAYTVICYCMRREFSRSEFITIFYMERFEAFTEFIQQSPELPSGSR